MEQTVHVLINNDQYYELDEQFLVRLVEFTHSSTSAEENAFGEVTMGDAEGIGIIKNSIVKTVHPESDPSPPGVVTVEYDDLPPRVSLYPPIDGSATTEEGDAGLRVVRVGLRVEGFSAVPIHVSLTTSPGTAVEDADFENTADYVFDSKLETVDRVYGALGRELTFFVRGDIRTETPGEDFFVNLLGANDATIGDNHVEVKINDDDPRSFDHGPWSVSFDWSSFFVRESDGFIDLKVVRADRSSDAVVVLWSKGGTATYGGPGAGDYTDDFDLSSGGARELIRFAPGETEKTLRIRVNDDAAHEPNETIQLCLRNPAGGPARGQYTQTTVTILDDDPPPTVSVADASAAEGSDLNFVVSLPTGTVSDEDITFSYRVVSQTAFRVDDFTSELTGTVTLRHGTGSTSFGIRAVQDFLSEPDEKFLLILDGVVSGSAILGDCVATGTVRDNDPVTLSGRVYQDTNGNGAYDSGEFGLSGVLVHVVDSQGTTTDRVTDVTGSYRASVLLGAVRVTVDESTVPSGYEASSGGAEVEIQVQLDSRQLPWIGYASMAVPRVDPESVGSEYSTNSDVAFGGMGDDRMDGGGGDDELIGGHWLGACGACEGMAYTAQLLRTASATYAPRWILNVASIPAPGSISGRLFYDTNSDGIRNDVPLGSLPQVIVTLFNDQYQIVDPTLSASDGTYNFEHLPPCVYHVQIIPPHGYDLTIPNVAGSRVETDSDFDVQTAISVQHLDLSAHRDWVNVDAGLVDLANPQPGPWSVSFDAPVYVVRERTGIAGIVLNRSEGADAVLAALFTSDGTAWANEDYLVVRQIVRFRGLGLLSTVPVTILRDGDGGERLQTVLLHLRNPAGGPAEGNRSEALLIIIDEACPDDDIIHGGDGADYILGDNGYWTEDHDAMLLGGAGADQLHGCVGHGDELGGERPLWGPSEGNHELKATAWPVRPCGEEA